MNDKLYINAYIQYRKQLKKSQFGENLPLASYDNVEKLQSGEGMIFFYNMMLYEHHMQIVNDINRLRRNLISLDSWITLIKSYDKDSAFYLHVEFLEPLIAYLNDLPYIIRNRFIYSLSHLCHQANRYKVQDWKDNLVKDININFKTMDKMCIDWDNFKKFKSIFKNLAGDNYKGETIEYRNRWHHRLPIRTGIGISNLVTRNIDSQGKVSYSLGYINPISYEKTIEILREQHKIAIECLKIYQDILHSQVTYINQISLNNSNE